MKFTCETVLNFIAQIGGIGGHGSLLTHQQHVACHCLRTVSEKERKAAKSLLSTNAKIFSPHKIIASEDATKHNKDIKVETDEWIRGHKEVKRRCDKHTTSHKPESASLNRYAILEDDEETTNENTVKDNEKTVRVLETKEEAKEENFHADHIKIAVLDALVDAYVSLTDEIIEELKEIDRVEVEIVHRLLVKANDNLEKALKETKICKGVEENNENEIESLMEEEVFVETATSVSEEGNELSEQESEDGFLHDMADDDSEKAMNVIELHGKIARLQYQNVVNIQRLHELECDDEKKSRKLLEKDALMMKYKKENEELKKELAAKKKFVFNMQSNENG